MKRTQADQLISQLGAALGIDALELDEAGTCLLALEDESVITIGYDSHNEQLVLMSPLDAVQPHEENLRTMLSANFMWQRTRGATFALTPNGSAALMARALPDSVDLPGLQTAIEKFALHAQACNSALSKQSVTTSKHPPLNEELGMIRG